MNTKFFFLVACLILALAIPRATATPVSGLKATVRDGQVFLTWKEAQTPEHTTFNVYVADHPISEVSGAKRVGHHVEQHSARDWWEDPASFTKGATPGKPVGFRITNDGQRLNPQDGLFVHTPAKEGTGKLFFAVTSTDPDGHEDTALSAGVNSLTDGVTTMPGAIKPIWQRDGSPPAVGAGKDKPLCLEIHGKGGVVANPEYLFFGDETMGWREGLPFKFSMRVEGAGVVVRPTDRVWINRPHDEASDGGTPAIWTFWYGYNSHIYDRSQMGTGVPTNYTERRNLWMLNWVSEQYQPDPNRWYCSGSSMGGCGTVSFGMHHPELFAACDAYIPIVAYNELGEEDGKRLGQSSASRLAPSCWTGPIPPDLKTNEGVPLLDRLNGTKFIAETTGDLPFLFMVNSRLDGSIPWQNNPPFYRALGEARDGFAAYWDQGTHATCGKDAPDDVKAWMQRFRRFRLNESYPAFDHTSSNRNPGQGRRDDGDPIGWINRGMDWKDIEDTGDHYAITLTADFPDIQYPVRTDVTFRRVQQFKTQPGEKLSVRIGDAAPIAITADTRGRITVPQVSISSKEGVRVLIQR